MRWICEPAAGNNGFAQKENSLSRVKKKKKKRTLLQGVLQRYHLWRAPTFTLCLVRYTQTCPNLTVSLRWRSLADTRREEKHPPLSNGKDTLKINRLAQETCAVSLLFFFLFFVLEAEISHGCVAVRGLVFMYRLNGCLVLALNSSRFKRKCGSVGVAAHRF